MVNILSKCFNKILGRLKITELIDKYHRVSEFKKDYKKFKQLSNIIPRLDGMQTSNADLFPVLDDKTLNTNYDHHYVYHTSWAARVLKEQGTIEHVDIGSHHYFAALVSAFIPFRFYDYRPMDIRLGNLHSGRADLMHLDFKDNSIF